MAWRNCNASMTLVAAVNARWPGRDKASDGTIGDAAHASRTSDHNPWVKIGSMGIVRARDIDKDGIDAAWLAEQLRLAGRAGDSRLRNGGYVIYNRRITRPDFSGWSVYTGSNPHTSHVHVSFSRDRAGFDSTASWGFLGGGAATTPAAPPSKSSGAYEPWQDVPPGSRVLSRGKAGTDVQVVQRWHGITADGYFGPATEDKVRATQRRNKIAVDGVVGPNTWRLMGIGGPAPRRIPPFPLPSGHYFGLITGPAKSHGGFYANEQPHVRVIQEALQRWGYAPNRPGWADGKFERPTHDAVAAWQRDHMPGTRYFGQVWGDDWKKLLSR